MAKKKRGVTKVEFTRYQENAIHRCIKDEMSRHAGRPLTRDQLKRHYRGAVSRCTSSVVSRGELIPSSRRG